MIDAPLPACRKEPSQFPNGSMAASISPRAKAATSPAYVLRHTVSIELGLSPAPDGNTLQAVAHAGARCGHTNTFVWQIAHGAKAGRAKALLLISRALAGRVSFIAEFGCEEHETMLGGIA